MKKNILTFCIVFWMKFTSIVAIEKWWDSQILENHDMDKRGLRGAPKQKRRRRRRQRRRKPSIPYNLSTSLSELKSSILSSALSSNSASGRIIGGKPATKDSYAFLVALFKVDDPSGSLPVCGKFKIIPFP
jgi:hypothetical protein